jgi:hypothetical protein
MTGLADTFGGTGRTQAQTEIGGVRLRSRLMSSGCRGKLLEIPTNTGKMSNID